MTVSEEEALLPRFGKVAGAGEMLNIQDLKAAYEQAIGHATSNSTVLQSSGPARLAQADAASIHPNRDLAAQNVLKKRLSRCGEKGSAQRPPGVGGTCASCSPMKRASAA